MNKESQHALKTPPIEIKDKGGNVSETETMESIQDPLNAQTLRERIQRQEIGKRVGKIVTYLPLAMLLALWGFIIVLVILCPYKLKDLTILISVMFSATHVAVIALYAALISGVFQKIGKQNEDGKISSNLVNELITAVTKALRDKES